MSRKKKVTTITEEIPENVLETLPDGMVSDIPDEETLAQVLEQFGHQAQVKVKVSKMTAKGPAYCFSTDGDIDEDFIQSEYGGGLYSCRIFIDGAFKKNVKLNIADRLNPITKTQAASAGDLQLQMMQQQNAFLMSLITKFTGGGSTATPVGELTDAMSKLHQMNGGGSKSEIDTLVRGMELAMKFNGGGNGSMDWKSELLEVARDVLKPIAPVVAKHFLGNPPAQTEQQPVNETQQLQITEAQIVQQLALGIRYLKPKALKGSDPGLWIDLVAENADEYGPFIHFVLTKDFGEFAKIDAEIANEPYATWFKHLYDGLRSAFTETPDLDDHPAGENGDAGNVVHDAQFGASSKSASGKAGA